MRKILLLLVLLSTFRGMGSHMAGGEIAYVYKGNLKYDVTFKIYRDCRGDVINNVNFKLLWVGKSYEQNIYPSLVSIKDISNTCSKYPVKCNPSNKKITSSSPIFEEHTYFYQIDFNNAENALQYACLVQIGMGECCRGSGITTGGANNDFWVTSSIDLCKNPKNSSPIFSAKPEFTVCCNQPASINFNAVDSIDNDSLSYRFYYPMQSFTDSVKWQGGRNYKSPIQDYWPSGYDKNKGPNPQVNPPIGTYLDPNIGLLVYTPTDCSEYTKLAVYVSEWRKDNTGKFNKIGEVVRDVALITMTCPDNNPPILYGPYKYETCVGNKICFTIASDDKQFIPSPPNKPNPPDTVTLTWNNGNTKGASFMIEDTSARLPRLKFCWTPKESDLRDLPYTFTVTANDNFCLLSRKTTKAYSVYIRKIATSQMSISTYKNNIYVFKSQIDKSFKGTPYYVWEVLDSTLNSLNSYYYFFKKTYLTTSNKANDTIVFRKAGKYIVKHSINNTPYNCPSIYFDTLTIPEVIDASISFSNDTLICKGAVLNYKARVTNGFSPFTYKWGSGKADTISTLSIIGLRDTTIELEVTDAKGQKAFSWCKIKIRKPTSEAGPNKVICNYDSALIQGLATNFGGTINWSWYFKGNKIGNQSVIKVNTPGLYLIEAKDSAGCYSKDSMTLKHFPFNEVQLRDSVYCQNVNLIDQKALIKIPSSLNSFRKAEWQIIKSLKKPNGQDNAASDLITDWDITSTYNFSLAFDTTRIDLSSSKQDILMLSLTLTDSNFCRSSDTNLIVLNKNPSFKFITQNKTFCRNDGIDLDTLLSTDASQLIWSKSGGSGYQSFPVSGIIQNGIVFPHDFYYSGGLYRVSIEGELNQCITHSFVVLNVVPNPLIKVSKNETKDSIKFTDISTYGKTRTWYLDTSFYSNIKAITLEKKQIKSKTISLKIKNDNCQSDTQFVFNPAGITQLKSDFITISPNPAHNQLLIKSNVSPPLELKITNQLGQTIFTQMLIKTEESIDISNLSKGIYFIEVKANENVGRVKFVKE
jgi:hypothetical protein